MLEENFKFMGLQLFAEDGTTDTDIVEDTNDIEGVESDVTDSDESEYALDDEGNLIIKDIAEPTGDETPPTEDDDETNVEDSNEQPPTESKYKVKIDGEELEVELSELLQGYQRQADYTKKTQVLADERKRIAQAVEQLQNPQQDVTQQPPANSAKDFYEGVANLAKESVIKDLNEEFDEFNPVHIAAMTLKVNQITAGMQKQLESQNAVQDFETKSRTKEPENYDAIYEYAREKVDVIPYRDRVALESAFSRGDVKVMEGFFEQMRKDYYNSKGMVIPGETTKPVPTKINKNKTQPPIIEGAGNGTPPQVKTRDASKLGSMNTDQQARWLIDMGIV